MLAFIDESGNLGRGGRYFTIAAILFDNKNDTYRIKRLIKKSRLKYNNCSDEVKFRLLNFEDRQSIVNKINVRPDFDIAYITLDKSKSTLLKENKDKNLVYNYLSGLLAKSIIEKYNKDCVFVFDQRSSKVGSLNSLPDYIKIEAMKIKNYKGNVSVYTRDSRTEDLLQAADIIAGAVNGSFHRGNHHFIDVLRNRIEIEEKFPYRLFGK